MLSRRARSSGCASQATISPPNASSISRHSATKSAIRSSTALISPGVGGRLCSPGVNAPLALLASGGSPNHEVSEMAHLKTIQSLQAGRGLAAFYVVLHHADLAAASFGASRTHVAFFANGYLGVDFFFVLSGFIIYQSTVGWQRTASDYAVARFRRVYLPYLPIGIGIALLYAMDPSLSEGNRSWSWLPTLTLLPVSSDTALSVAWTLKHEILFYS